MTTKVMLSTHFSLREMTRSDLATRHNLDNTPPPAAVENLRALCGNVLEHVRAAFQKPLVISSGFRSPEVNELAGGNKLGSHPLGEAADFEIPGVDNREVARWIAKSDLPFDQLILEFYVEGDSDSGWLHVSHRKANNRRQALTATRVNGKTVYAKFVP